MLPSKTKSGLSEASSAHKSTAASPRVSKLPNAGPSRSDSNSTSTLQKSRTTVNRSPRSVDSKPTTERRSPRIGSGTDKQPRVLKGSEFQAQLDIVQEELKKAIQRLASVEVEKAQALEELKDAKRLSDETNEKLQEALAAKKKAEESLEIEKFRADEMELSGIEASRKRNAEWRKEIESIQSQHATDIAALVSAKEEIEKLKHELMEASDAKSAVLRRIDDTVRFAEINAEKVETLSAEVNRLKTLLDSKVESLNNEAAELVRKLDSEVNALKGELERAKVAEEKLVEMEALVEGLRREVTDAKMAELEASKQVDEWKKKVDLLERQVEEASQAQQSLSDSLVSAMKEMEENNVSLQEAQSKIDGLNEKVESLETEVARKKAELEESSRHLDAAKQEALKIGREAEILKSNLQSTEAANLNALNNEKAAISNSESLVKERNKLMIELEVTKEEGDKLKKAMEDLASALHEASAEARENQERLLTKQAEADDAHTEIEELKLTLKNTKENYEVMLDEAKYEIVCLRKAVERIEVESKNSREEWDAQELNFLSAIKKAEEEIAALKLEIGMTFYSRKGAKKEFKATKEEENQIQNQFRQAQVEASMTSEDVEQIKAESLKFKERLLDKENELQSVTQDNDELRIREASALEKIKELSALLEETKAKRTKENDKLFPKKLELSEESADQSKTGEPKSEASRGEDLILIENGYGNRIDDEPVKVEIMDLSAAKEHDEESVDDEIDSKVDTGNFGQSNGSISPSRQKKKKALLGKFGSLLKKKNHYK